MKPFAIYLTAALLVAAAAPAGAQDHPRDQQGLQIQRSDQPSRGPQDQHADQRGATDQNRNDQNRNDRGGYHPVSHSHRHQVCRSHDGHRSCRWVRS